MGIHRQDVDRISLILFFQNKQNSLKTAPEPILPPRASHEVTRIWSRSSEVRSVSLFLLLIYLWCT
jgi:hypothetical protein